MDRFSFLPLVIAGWLAASALGPADARATPMEGATIPQDILIAYEEASKQTMYVCPRDAIKKIDDDLRRLEDEIRRRFQKDLAAPDGEVRTMPTTCHSPESYPDFAARIKSYAKAVKNLEEVLRRR